MKKLLYTTVILFIFITTACVTDTDNGNNENNPDNNQIPPTEQTEQFEVSEELYTQTFDEIAELINTLNDYIARKNYKKWLFFLSDIYKKNMSNPETLSIYSETPILKSNNIKLKTLEDYFKWVVVPSRSNVRLDELVFKDESHVTAYMIIEGKSIILYQLEIIDDNWKITVW